MWFKKKQTIPSPWMGRIERKQRVVARRLADWLARRSARIAVKRLVQWISFFFLAWVLFMVILTVSAPPVFRVPAGFKGAHMVREGKMLVPETISFWNLVDSVGMDTVRRRQLDSLLRRRPQLADSFRLLQMLYTIYDAEIRPARPITKQPISLNP